MSLDSVTRINAYFETIAVANSIYTIYDDKNEAIEDDMGGGEFVRLSTEASFLNKEGQPSTLGDPRCYKERGLIIVEIFSAKGLGNMNLYGIDGIVTILGEAFVDERILPTGSEEGIILFEDISAPKAFEQPSRGGTDYYRKDVFINYQKNYSK